MDELRTALCRGVATLSFTTMFALAAHAVEPAALLEDATPEIAGMGLMESLYPGQVIALRPGQTVVLAYLNSCLRETVQGGQITIGAERSTASGGSVKAEPVTPCGTSRLALSPEQARAAGVIVTRGPVQAPPKPADAQAQKLLTTAPAFMLTAPGPMVLQRIDRSEQVLTLDGARGAIDFARVGLRLVRGATYRVESGGRSTTITIDPVAVSGGTLLSRLVRL